MKINSLGIMPYTLIRNQQKEYNNISFKRKEKEHLPECIGIGLVATLPYLIMIPTAKYVITPDNCRDINKIVRYVPKEINTDKESVKINNLEEFANSIKFDANINGKNTNIKLELNNISQTETEGKVTIKDSEKCEIVDIKTKNIAPDAFECKFNNKKLLLNNNNGKITIKDEEGKIIQKFKLDIPYIQAGLLGGTLFLIGACLLIAMNYGLGSAATDYTDNDGYFD